MVNIIIGIIMIISFVGMVIYCVKGLNLMVGFVLMGTFWLALAFVGNSISPTATMEGKSLIDVLTYVYAEGPAGYAKAILVNIYFGAFFGRVLTETGIAATLIRKVVELSGDKTRLTMSLLCIVTSVIFMSMTGIGPVISVAVIVLPIFLSIGIPAPIALFSFMGSIAAGMFANEVQFNQYRAIYEGFNKSAADYSFSGNYFKIGIIFMIIELIMVLVVSNISLGKSKKRAWAVNSQQTQENAPAISWLAIVMPVVLSVGFKVPIILGFIVSSLYALVTTGKLKGSYSKICGLIAKLFADGATDVAPMIGFLLSLSMFSNAATFAAPYFTSILSGAVPKTALILCVTFAVLTPFGFFRGPMNLVGSGTAILAVVVATLPNAPVAFLYPLFAITTLAPQCLDITQSWVAWGLGYTKVSTKDYMKMSIPTGWIVGILSCIAVYILYGKLM